MRNRSVRGFVVVLSFSFAMLLGICCFADTPFAGKFSDGKLTVDLSPSADGYTGTFSINGQQYPATAHANAANLDGTFTAGGNALPFNGSLAGDTLTLTSDGTTYMLRRVTDSSATPFNPLANSAPANSSANSANGAPAPAGAAPAGYTVVAQTATGKSLFTQKPNATNVMDALKATFPDLEAYFGSRPNIGSAFQGAQDANSGGATFSETLAGQPVRGVVSVDVKPGAGAVVNVVYCNTNAPRADWETLMKPSQNRAPSAGDAAAPPAPQPVPGGKEFDFPDGTGSMQIPDGWTVTGNSENHPVRITGPNDQIIWMHLSIMVFTPDSRAVQMRKQMEAQDAQRKAWLAQHANLLPPPPAVPPVHLPPMFVAPFSDPVTALQALQPQLNAVKQSKGGPTNTIDQIVSAKALPNSPPNSKAQFVVYDTTRTNPDGTSVHNRTRAILMCNNPQGQGMWQFFVGASMTAHVDAMDAQLPLMRSIVNSNKPDQQRMMQVAQAENEEQQKMAATLNQAQNEQSQALYQMGQDNMRTQQDIHDQQQQATEQQYADERSQFKQDQYQKSRNDADQVESIIGNRMIYDTVTGQSGYANLPDAGAVVDSLNEAALDPNRFIQIPLRDQLYPNPPGQ